MNLKKIAKISFYLQMIIFLILAIILLTDTSQKVNFLTNNQLLGLIILLFVLFLTNRRKD